MNVIEQSPSPAKMEKVFMIVINGRRREEHRRELTFRDVVALAFDAPTFNDAVAYTVTFSRGHGEKPEGSLVDGQSVRIKEGMIFNVTCTDKS